MPGGDENPEGSFVHATAVVIREAGVLVRGPSGAGKSTLAAQLIWEAERSGLFARLVGDDRIALVARHGRVIARPHPAVAGLIEQRGRGIVPVAFERACVLALVVDLIAPAVPPRLPADDDRVTTLCGSDLVRLALGDLPAADACRLVLQALEQAV